MKLMMTSAALIALVNAAPAAAESAAVQLVQYYGTPYYAPLPYREWQREEYRGEQRAEERRSYWEARRRAGWRCDHGDYGACRWLTEHS